MRHGRGSDRKVRLILSVTALLLVAACSSGEENGSPVPSKSSTGSAPAATATAASGEGEAKAVLDKAFTTRESLGSGGGSLAPQFGNTHPGAPDDVLSVTFAFTCTGGAKVGLKVATGGEEVQSAAGSQTCDGSIFQRSVDVSEGRALSFEADVTGSENGGFAYAYYAEKKQLPPGS